MQGQLLANDDPVGLSKHDRLCDFLPICLVTAVVFDLNVEVEAALARITLVTLSVGTGQPTLNFISTPSVVLFAPGQVPLSGRPLQIFIAVIELL